MLLRGLGFSECADTRLVCGGELYLACAYHVWQSWIHHQQLCHFHKHTITIIFPHRYVFGHYGAFIAALVGSYLRNYDPQVTYTIYGLALLGLVCVLALLKVTIFIARLVAGRSVGTRSELEPLTEK